MHFPNWRAALAGSRPGQGRPVNRVLARASHPAPTSRSRYRLRFLPRALRRLPLGRDGLAYSLRGGAPPPPPPPAKFGRDARGGRASAALTRRLRPPSSLPSNSAIAFAAASSSANSTKAKPRGRPVARSAGRKTSTMVPADEKRASISGASVSKLRLPTNTLAEMVCSFLPKNQRPWRFRVASVARLSPPPAPRSWSAMTSKRV